MSHHDPHMHLPDELADGGEQTAESKPERHRMERVLELGAVVLLSVTMLATAWSGYQAAHWSGEQLQRYTEASAMRVRSAQEATRAGQSRIDDQLYFNGWLDARSSGNLRLAEIYRRRFRPEFRPVFRAWLAQRPFSNPRAIAGPLYMPQYRPAALVHAEALDARAERLFRDGIEAKGHDEDYILSTVFFAAVLFFASISLRVDWLPLRLGVFALASGMLVVGVVFALGLPTA